MLGIRKGRIPISIFAPVQTNSIYGKHNPITSFTDIFYNKDDIVFNSFTVFQFTWSLEFGGPAAWLQRMYYHKSFTISMHRVLKPFERQRILTHWGLEKWPQISWRLFKCIFLNENIQISIIKISPKFVPEGQINNFQHRSRLWSGAGQATSHYLNQWWLVCWGIYASPGLNELIPTSSQNPLVKKVMETSHVSALNQIHVEITGCNYPFETCNKSKKHTSNVLHELLFAIFNKVIEK